MAKKKKRPKPTKEALAFYAISWLLLIVGIILTSVGGIYFASTGQELNTLQLLQPAAWPALVTESRKIIGQEAPHATLRTQAGMEDARAVIVANFLERYKSPLRPYEYYGQQLVQIADQFNLDFRLLPAIAMQESNLCKVIPRGSYNCLGLGVHAKGTWGFDSFEQNFAAAAKILKENYIDIGLTTPELIMSKYTPHSNGSWAFSVNRWMTEMRYDDPTAGKNNGDDANLLEFSSGN